MREPIRDEQVVCLHLEVASAGAVYLRAEVVLHSKHEHQAKVSGM